MSEAARALLAEAPSSWRYANQPWSDALDADAALFLAHALDVSDAI